MARVETRRGGGIGWLILADPDRRNAIDLEIAASLVELAHDLDHDPGVHALIVTGRGSAFCAGADRAVLASADKAALRSIYDAFLCIQAMSLPTIGAVNGPAVGAGMNLALACDVRIAAESARFESRFLQLPIHPGGGHTWMLQRLVGPQVATVMSVLDQPISGKEAERIGLAWRCVPDDDLTGACEALCASLVNSPTPRLARSIKRTLRATAAEADFGCAVELELTKQVESMDSRAFEDRMRRRS